MAWTKRDVIESAFTEIGLAGSFFDLSAQELQEAMYKLDSMMGVWSSQSIVFTPTPYPQPTTKTGGDLDDTTNAPDEANEAMFLNLAIRLAPSYGKAVPPDTKVGAKAALNNLAGNFVVGTEMCLTGTIKGAGAKRPIRPFIEEEVTS